MIFFYSYKLKTCSYTVYMNFIFYVILNKWRNAHKKVTAPLTLKQAGAIKITCIPIELK